MADLLPVENFPAVRASLDTRLTTTNLPDPTIKLSIFRDRAIRYVTSRLVNFTPQVPEHLTIAQEATAVYCAALLVWSVIDATRISVSARDNTYSKPAWKPSEKEKVLKASADELINYLNDLIAGTPPDQGVAERLISAFTTAAGTRMTFGD